MSVRRCADCKRVLRKEVGPYGPRCARKRSQLAAAGRTGVPRPDVPTALSQRLTRPPVTVSPGQGELPLVLQPTLWSKA